jgi:methionine synthase II (cobalamin-independent)
VKLAPHAVKLIEDRAVDQAIALQEGCGLDVVSDGELRRFSFLDHLLAEVDGVVERPGAGVTFHGAGGRSGTGMRRSPWQASCAGGRC